MIELDTEAIVRQLAGRIAQLEVDLAVARSQIPPPVDELAERRELTDHEPPEEA